MKNECVINDCGIKNGRKLFVYTKKELINDDISKLMINTWYDLTKECRLSNRDIYTTNIAVLRDAQSHFEEVYIDNEIIWPNEKQQITKKELRFGHDISRLVASWYRFTFEGEKI